MILIPARNEAPRIGGVVREVRRMVPGVPVVVVVNGTTDDTAEVAEAAGAEVIHAEPGYGTALMAGYRHALSKPSTDWGYRWTPTASTQQYRSRPFGPDSSHMMWSSAVDSRQGEVQTSGRGDDAGPSPPLVRRHARADRLPL